MAFKVLSQALWGRGSILSRGAFFDGAITCYIILYCKEQQVTLIYLLIYLIYLFVFCQLRCKYLLPPNPYCLAEKNRENTRF